MKMSTDDITQTALKNKNKYRRHNFAHLNIISFKKFYFSDFSSSLLVRVVAGAPPRALPPTSPLASSGAAALAAPGAASGGSQLPADPFRLADCRH